jgi:mannan polymerase II complex MNN10 subunit
MARIATVTAHFGPVQQHYQEALQTHVLHSLVHNTKLHVMCSPIVDELWNKPAFILALLLNEMVKPAEERLEWIFWADRDTVVLDQCRSLSDFLPPSVVKTGNKTEEIEEIDPGHQIHLLITDDWNGLNNGGFLLRVNLWAIHLFNVILAFRYYRPDIQLTFTEQSAMEVTMMEPQFRGNVPKVPQQWFNAYPKGNASAFLESGDVKKLATYHARRGDFLMHFAGVPGRGDAIEQWTRVSKELPAVWPSWQLQRDTTEDISKFWDEYSIAEGQKGN